MKRFFALAALVLGLAACQTEPEGLDVNVGGEVDTTITVSLPETTRANSAHGAFDNVVTSDDYTIRYIFQVFYGEAESQATRQVIYTDNDQVSFPVRLVPNRHYNFVVWADVVPQGDKTAIMNTIVDYDAAADYHYNTANLKDIKIIDVDGGHEWEEMDETRDAFTGQYDTAVDGDQTPYNGAKNISFSLTRPFAKLRVITTDMEQLNDLVIAPTKAAVTYTTDLYSSFNAFAGVVNTATMTKAHTTFTIKDYTDNVNDESKVLFTDYLFAADQDEVVNFTLTVYDQGDVVIGKTINFNTPIPARRNYLTTISGNILTDGNKIEVTVTDEFANAGSSTTAPYYQETISSVAELLAAIDAGGEYILISDLDVNGVTTSALAATRAAGNGTTINLNGYTITLKTNLTIPEGKTVIINNDPVDDAADKLGAVVNDGGKIINNGTLNIEGGYFGENTIQNNGTANVSGGDFADDAIVNNGSVSVEGDNSGEEDRIIENGTNAVVSNIVYTIEELQDALDEGKVDEIIFGADLVGEATISQREGVNVYINGAGKKFDGVLYIHGNARSTGAETVKIANINFESESAKYFIHANYQTEPQRYAHNVTIEGCTFTSLADDNSVAVCGASFRQAYNVTIKNCTANNTFYLAWFSGCYNVAIEGCEAYNNYEGITLGRGSTTSIKNSKINAELYGVRIESVSSGVETHNVTINNCELNAFIPVSVRSLTTGKFNLALQGVNKLTRGGLYDIALCSNEYKEGAVAKAPTCEWTISGADDFIVFPREYAVKSVDQIAEALTLKSKVLFADNIEGNVYIAQQDKFNVVIDGRGYQFDGTFTIDGMNRNEGAETLTLKNINFYTESTDEKTFISCPSTYNGANERYSHNVTIENCTFRASSLTEKVGAISAQKTYHLAVMNCEAYNIHSLLQVQSCDNDVTVENVKVENCFSGISVGNTKTTTISGANIKTQKYGIRLDGETSRKVTVNVANSNIEAYIPIVARKVSTGCNVDVNLTETTLVKKNNDMFDVVFQNNKDYEDGNVTPVAPTGTYTLTGAEAYNVFPDYVNIATETELKDAFALGIRNISLNGDIALTEAWTPVGNAEKPWYGVFDGKNHKISGLTVEGVEYAAFISHTAANSTVKNLTLENVYLDSTKHAAGVVCVAGEGLTLENVKVSGNIVAASYAGGIMHNGANATIKNCENSANVSAQRAGGIASWVTVGAVIDSVVNRGTITGTVGASGIAHGFAGSIKNAKNYGTIISNNVEAAAGIAGVQKGASTYEYCYNYGNVTSTFDNPNASAAGILGQNPGSTSTLKYCANYGEIKAEKSYAAGIAYSLYGTINASYCYNNGAVYGADGAGAIAPKAQYGAGDKANYCLNAGVITSNGIVYQGSNNNVSCYYYNNGELYNVKDNTVADVNAALALLNGGTDANFFEVENDVITVK